MHTDEHEHIKSLKARATRRAKDREAYRKSKNIELDREKTISEAPQEVVKDFWCDDCKLDVSLVAYKCIENDWTNKGQRIAYHGSQCPCGAILKRRISDSWSDPYFTQSFFLKKERIKHQKDILQPHETGYQMLYGNK